MTTTFIHQIFLDIIKPNPVEANELSKQLIVTPIYVKPVVTVSDAKTGVITRYFTYLLNEPLDVVEIDSDQYQRFKENPRFLTTSIEWKIVGEKNSTTTSFGVRVLGVEDFNRQQVTQADLTFKNLHKYITDYTEYWLGERI